MTAERELELVKRIDTLIQLAYRVLGENNTTATWRLVNELLDFAVILRASDSIHTCTK